MTTLFPLFSSVIYSMMIKHQILIFLRHLYGLAYLWAWLTIKNWDKEPVLFLISCSTVDPFRYWPLCSLAYLACLFVFLKSYYLVPNRIKATVNRKL